MFNLAVRWEMVERSPVPGVERNHEEPRHRYLDGAELGRLVEALAISPNRDAANVIRLLLLTGARRMEVMAARWEQFDLGSGTWTKPAAFTKQNKLHSVPLSAPARLLLAEMREAADRRAAGANRPASPFLFPTPVAAI